MWKQHGRPDSAMSADSLELPPIHDKYPKQVHIPAVNKAENKKLIQAKSKNTKNYLIINRKPRKSKSYLEKFREKLYKNKEDEIDVMSIEARFGDSDIGSVADDSNMEEFIETECYNEIVYHLIINGRNFEGCSVSDDVKTEPPTMTSRAAFSTSASVCPTTSTAECVASSDVTGMDSASTRRPAQGRTRDYRPAHDKAKETGTRGSAREKKCAARCKGDGGSGMGDVPVCRLGGLGPDMEALRPRLERARSMQRYSVQVRLDNKIRISRHKSLSNTRTSIANTETDKHDTANKQSIQANEKSANNVIVDRKRFVKQTGGAKPEGISRERETRNRRLGKKETEITNDSSRGDNNGMDAFRDINLSFDFQLDSFRSCDVYKSQVLRTLEEQHIRYRDAVSDVCRNRECRERPRAMAATRRLLPPL